MVPEVQICARLAQSIERAELLTLKVEIGTFVSPFDWICNVNILAYNAGTGINWC